MNHVLLVLILALSPPAGAASEPATDVAGVMGAPTASAEALVDLAVRAAPTPTAAPFEVIFFRGVRPSTLIADPSVAERGATTTLRRLGLVGADGVHFILSDGRLIALRPQGERLVGDLSPPPPSDIAGGAIELWRVRR